MTHKMLSRSPTYQFNNDIYALNMYQYPCSVPGFAVGHDWNEYVANTQYCRAYNYYPNWYHQKKMSCPKKRKRSFTIREILGLDNDEPENNTDCFPSENLLPPRLTPEPVQVSSIRCFENEEFPHRVETVSSSDSYISSDSPSYRLSPPCLEPQSSNDCRSFEDVLSPSKRSKRIRTTFTPQQLEKLELEFKRTQYMVGSARIQLASELNLTESQVKVWFQNRRIKLRKQSHEMQQAKLEKLKATESEEKECESNSNFSNQISSSSSSRDDSQRSV